jgi:hypothetical protein
MSSYLEAYGAAEEQRARRIRILKVASIVVVAGLIIGLTLYSLLKNRSEEQQAKFFVQLLQQHDYTGAYRLWGCTDTNPCPNYPFSKFMADWGPQSPHADESTAQIGISESCGSGPGSGVVIRLDYQGSEQPVPLWVERDSKLIGFAPWEECPGRHLHLRAWLKSVFSR